MLKGKKFDAFALFQSIEHKFQTIEHRIILSKNYIFLSIT